MNRKATLTATTAALLLAISAMTQSTDAALVSVNILGDPAEEANGGTDTDVIRNNTFGVFSDDDPDYVWNDIVFALTDNGVKSSFLQDTDGNTTNIRYTHGPNNQHAANWEPNDNILNEGSFGKDTETQTLTISGLVVGTQYELVVFDSTTYPTDTQTVEGNVPTAFANELVGATNYVDGLTDAGTYAYWLATADANGELNWIGNSTDDYHTLTGFQIRVVPEPASGAMALIVLGAMAMRRRRG